MNVWVSGRPAPKGSRVTATTKDGRTYTRPASKYEKPWIEAVAHATAGEPMIPPYRVVLRFRLPRPKKPAHPWVAGPDVDKLARSTIDGLVRGGVLTDDRYVLSLDASKDWGEEAGCLVTVESLKTV